MSQTEQNYPISKLVFIVGWLLSKGLWEPALYAITMCILLLRRDGALIWTHESRVAKNHNIPTEWLITERLYLWKLRKVISPCPANAWCDIYDGRSLGHILYNNVSWHESNWSIKEVEWFCELWCIQFRVILVGL